MAVERIPITSRDEWLKLRRGDVTASQIGGLFGAHKYWTPARVYADKLGLPLPGGNPMSAVIRRGNVLEPIVAGMVQEMHPEWIILKATEYLRDPELQVGATPDYWLEVPGRGRGPLECKTVGSGVFAAEWFEAEDGARQPPLWITLQLATQMMLSDASFGFIAALVVGEYVFDLHIVEVERQAYADERLRDGARDFWAAIAEGRVPALDPQRDRDLVRLMFPAAVPGKIVDLTGDNMILELLDTREAAISDAKDAEERRKAAEVQILEKIADAETAIVPGWRVTNKTQHRREVIQKESTYRVLRASRERAA